MPTMFDEAARNAMFARLDRLTTTTARRWGGFTPEQMVFHLNAQMRNVLGEIHVPPRPTPPVFKWPLFHWLIIDSGMPWPKSTPTAPQYLSDSPGELGALVAELKERVHRMVANGEAKAATVHPAFGPLSGPQMGRLVWRHWNHHLTQFGL
ncbi:MAG: DinB family protein [Candidatus Eisenbacteria bacterium]|uniref:DinB family protein n=1 Tax=Eiseniibacteriota bacterium TaxID=2212470 RepID=A0A933SD22_UNCEI|nr:DinB family protein [Candidatus Eisenbacteria bacterium]